MKLPLANDRGQRRWKVDQSSDTGFDLLATKNMNFDTKGVALLSDRTITLLDEADSADFESPVSSYYNGELDKLFCTDEVPWSIDISDISPSLSADGLSNQPSGSIYSSGAMFNGSWAVSETGDIHSYTGGTWTDQSVSLTSARKHPMWVNKANNTLCVGNANQVKQYNTSYSETTNLSLPAGQYVVGGCYNRNFNAVITWDSENGEAFLYIWDGATAGANYAYPLGDNRAFFVAAYKDTFITLTGKGQLLYWTTGGLDQVAALPSFYTTAHLGDVNDTLNVANDTSWLVNGNQLLFNVSCGDMASRNSEPSEYNPLQGSGIWCYDPDVGLYHRYGHTGSKLRFETIATTDVDTSTNVITLGTIPAPETGTEVLYDHTGFTGISTLEPMRVYYVIYVSATTIKLASTYANAIAGTPIALPDTGNSSQILAYLDNWDLGQLDGGDCALLLTSTGPASETSSGGDRYIRQVFNEFAFGERNTNPRTLGSSNHIFSVVARVGINVGHILTQQIPSEGVIDAYKKIYVKPRGLSKHERNRIYVKYKDEANTSFPIIVRDGTATGEGCFTWTSSTTFTTAANIAAAKTLVDAGKQLEVEFTSGFGASRTRHITQISESAGTYTCTVDEAMENYISGDLSWGVFDTFYKLRTKANAEYMASGDDENYGEFSLPGDVKKKWVQFKIELRGYRVGIEMLDIVNTEEKPAL